MTTNSHQEEDQRSSRETPLAKCPGTWSDGRGVNALPPGTRRPRPSRLAYPWSMPYTPSCFWGSTSQGRPGPEGSRLDLLLLFLPL